MYSYQDGGEAFTPALIHSSYLTAQATKIFGQEDYLFYSKTDPSQDKRGALAEIRIARAQHLQTIWHLCVNGSRRLQIF